MATDLDPDREFFVSLTGNTSSPEASLGSWTGITDLLGNGGSSNNGQDRFFQCDLIDKHFDIACLGLPGKVPPSEEQCAWFNLNVCAVSPKEAAEACKNGISEEFFREFPCYCDDACLTKQAGTVAASILGFTLILGLLCVLLRHLRKPLSDEEIEKRLSVPRQDKPEPDVGSCSMRSFKWIPFTTVTVLTVWFVVSTALVIRWHGDPTIAPYTVAYMMTSTTFMAFWLLSNMTLIFNGARGLALLKKELKKTGPIQHTDETKHIVVLPNYKEDPDMIRATVLRLANQEHLNVKENVTVVLAMEQGEEGYWDKGEMLRQEFLPRFNDVIVTCHPRLPGEQPGKSSNMKWAYASLQQFVVGNKDKFEPENGAQETTPAAEGTNYATDANAYFHHPDIVEKTKASSEFEIDPNKTVITLMDADALSHPRFLASLSKKFEETEGNYKHVRFWQCPVFFYENLGEVDFINRAVTIVFGFNELANTGVIDLGLVGCNPRVPVNTYSMSWRLFDLIEGGDNFVVADESHNLFKAFHLTKGLARLDPIFLPISVYNVTSDNFMTGFQDRFTQIKRWMYGNAFEYSFWWSRYVGCSRSPNWRIPLLDKLPLLWRLFIFSSFNLAQPLYFALYGLSWAFYLKTPYFKTMATIFVTCIMTLFMVINVSIFVMHWFLVHELKIKGITDWPAWKKLIGTIFDAIIGVGAATVFFVLIAGIAANAQLLFTGGLTWGTEGRAKKGQEGHEAEQPQRRYSAATVGHARKLSTLAKNDGTDVE